MARLRFGRRPLYPRKPKFNVLAIDSLKNNSRTYIMQIAEGINIQNVDEAGSQAEVLKERGEHVHWVALHYNLVKQSKKEERKYIRRARN